MSEPHAKLSLTSDVVQLPSKGLWSRLPIIAWLVGLGAFAAMVAIGSGDTTQLLSSYLFAFMFVLSFALGGLFFVLVHYATRAGWSVVVRRIAENVMATMPLMAVLFIPIAVWGVGELFHWADAHAAHDPVIAGKSAYLNTTFFLVRAVLYFVIWVFLAWFFRSRSVQQDVTHAKKTTRLLQSASAPGLIAFGITITFAAFDWLMSLDPHWFSTMFGVYYFAGSVICIYAFLSIVSISLRSAGLLKDVITTEHFHDLGKLLFAFTVFWTYIAFSQYMLIWYANLPEETGWFMARWGGSWKSLSMLLGIGHFAVPFFFLMSRHIKRRPVLLFAGAVWMILMHMADIYWLVMPVFHNHHGEATIHFSVVDIFAVVGMFSVFLAAFAWNMRRSALVPVGDPRLKESLAFENF